MRRVVAVALAMVAATAVSHILHARLVAMSPQPTGLPPFVWLAVTSLPWVTGLTGGMCLRSWRQIALAALLAAVALQSYETWAINAPLLFWTVSIPATAGGIFSLLAAGRLIRLATQRLRVQRPRNDAHVASYEAFRDAGRRVKGPGALLIDTFRMYGSHWAGLVLACAVLWVPAVVVKQATYRLIAPGISDWMPEATAILREKIRTGRIDPEAAKSVRSAMEQALGGRAVRVLGRVTGFLFDDLIIPLIGGALSILVANRLLGGGARVRDAWTAVLGRLPRLLSALIPAAILRMLLGRIVPYAVVPVLFVLFVVSVALFSSPPAREFVVWASLYLDLALTSLVMTLVFVFIPAVVLFEDLGGTTALMRSLALLRADLRRAFLVLAALTGILGLAEISFQNVLLLQSFRVGALTALSYGWYVVELVLMPLPVVGAALLYFDLRRRLDGFDDERLRVTLAGLSS